VQQSTPFATPVIAGGVAVAMAPIIALNVLPHIADLIRFVGALFTVQRKKARLGVLVDSDAGKPIANAVIQVFDTKFHQLKETQVTGKDGQFGFLLPPGDYYMLASAKGFTFPSHQQTSAALKGTEQLYNGEEFTVKDDNVHTIPHIVMRMDRVGAVPNRFFRLRMFAEKVLMYVDRVGIGFLLIGALLSVLLFMNSVTPLNTIFVGIYLVLLSLKFYILRTHQHGIGTIVDAETVPVDSAIIRLYTADTNRITQTRITNIHGRFFLLVPKGTYTAVVSKAGYKTLTINNLHVFGNASKALALDIELKAEA
jgi:hypothetical protein